MNYVLFFLEMLFYTIGAVMICGLVVGLCERLMIYWMGDGIGRGLVICTSIIGTPVHELSHALMCLLFGHKIQKIKLWQPCSADGTLGYVTHSYRRNNPYHILGNLFIGIGPIFGGLGVMTLCMYLCFPQTVNTYFASVSGMVNGGSSVGAILAESLQMIPHMIGEFSSNALPTWARIVGLVVMFSVSMHINLSIADIKGAATAIPLYLALILIPTIIISLMGQENMDTVSGGLQIFSAFMFSLFAVVFVFCLLQLLVAFLVTCCADYLDDKKKKERSFRLINRFGLSFVGFKDGG